MALIKGSYAVHTGSTEVALLGCGTYTSSQSGGPQELQLFLVPDCSGARLPCSPGMAESRTSRTKIITGGTPGI